MILHPNIFRGDDVPLVYDLQYRSGVFYLSAPEAILNGLEVGRYQEMAQRDNPGLADFVNTDDFGFGGCFTPCSPRSAFAHCRSFRCELQPSIGKGTERTAARQLHATLAVLFALLEYVEAEANNCALQQLVKYGMMCKPDMNGASLWVTAAPSVREWVTANEEEAHRRARMAMMDVGKTMWPSYFAELGEDYVGYSYRCWRNGDGIIMEVPGDATSLCPDWDAMHRGGGWKWDSHNCDSDVQGLALLAGVCTLVYLSRRTAPGAA